MNTVFKFKGVTDILPLKGEPGDIWVVGRESYVWCDEWEETDGCEDTVREVVKEVAPSTCKKCGAPLDPYKLKCDFCGTYYTRNRGSLELLFRSGIDAEYAIECTCLGDNEPRYIT